MQARDLQTPAQFSSELARFFRTPILYNMIIICYKIGVLKNLAIFTAKFMWTAASGITENIYLFYQATNLVMFCRIDCKSVFKALNISTEMHFSTDLALMSSYPFTLTFIYNLSTLFTFMLHLHFFIYISFHQIGQSHSVLQNHSCMWSCHLPYITKRWWYCRFRLFKSEKWRHSLKDNYPW